MHGTTLAILAAIAHELAEREKREAAGDFDFNLLWFVPGYLVAVAIHTAFNQFPDRPLLAMMGAAIFAPIAIIGDFPFRHCRGAALARRRNAPSISAQLEALRAGHWPDEPEPAAGSPRLPTASIPKARSASAATGSCRRGWCSRPRRR